MNTILNLILKIIQIQMWNWCKILVLYLTNLVNKVGICGYVMNSTEQSPWEVHYLSASQVISGLVWHPKFIVVLVTTNHWSLIWAKWIQFISSHPISPGSLFYTRISLNVYFYHSRSLIVTYYWNRNICIRLLLNWINIELKFTLTFL